VGGDARTAGRTGGGAGSELDTEPGWAEPVDPNVAEPVDPDVAEPVTSAMAGTPGSGDQTEPKIATGPGSAPDRAPGGGMPPGATGGDAGGSATGQASTGTGATQRWPDPLAFPDGLGGDDPKLPVGDDLLELADARASLPTAADGADPPSTRAADPPSPVLGPPMPAAPDAVNKRPADRRRPEARSEGEQSPAPRVAPPAELGFDPFGEGV
jgi:hypothetical protein